MSRRFSSRVLAELSRARRKFPRPQHSVCEAREVLREEFDEFCEASRKGPQYAPVIPENDADVAIAGKAIDELVQVAAMAFRTAIEVYGFDEEIE